MKMTARSVWIVFLLVLAAFIPAQAKDEVVHMSYPSKVEGSKGKEREKLFSPWMTSEALRTYTEEKRGKGEQIIYFEYDSAGHARGIYTSKLKLKGPYSRWNYSDEKAMENKLNSEIKSGLQPAFIVRTVNGAFTMLLVSPEDMEAVRAELKALGISEPKMRK